VPGFGGSHFWNAETVYGSISRVAILLVSSAALALAAGGALAQIYPSKPVAFVVPFGPGTGNDIIARILAQKVSESWGQPMVVTNRPGATGGIGLEIAAKAAPDGHTIIIASTSLIINQHLSKARPDIVRDFAPVSLAGTLPYVLVVPEALPARSMKELVAMAKARPGKLNYTATIGGLAHFLGEMLKSAGDVDIVLIPTKLSSESEADILSGRTEIWFTTVASALPHVKAGKMRILGITGDKRASMLPDVPTMSEAGFPTLDASAHFLILAPAGTPKPVVSALNREIVKAVESKEVKDRLVAAGVEPTTSTPDELGTLIRNEVARWGKIVKETGIRVE
jgi:tripartite-type tricarboxylate transporter receptor subunit TctC